MKVSMIFLVTLLAVVACNDQITSNNQSTRDSTTSSVDFMPTSTPLEARVAIDCPIGLVNDLTLDEEFGSGTEDITRCIENHKEIKVVYSVNKACTTVDCNRAYALHNILNAIADYEVTNGLSLHLNYDIAAVFYASGSLLVVDNNAPEPFVETNPFQDLVEELLDKGVHVYLCQNSARHMGIVTANLIPGVEYVTAGVTAIADFQLSEYALVIP